jgi:(S)-ureidoglycine aminohydrolase
MSDNRYPKMHGPVPPQSTRLDTRAIVTEAYTFIPAGCQTETVSSRLPFWDDTLAWVIAKPLACFASTFSHYLMEVAAGGGSKHPETFDGVEHVLFVTAGVIDITINGDRHTIATGGYVYIPPSATWLVKNNGNVSADFHWIRKQYEAVDGLDEPDVLVTVEDDVEPIAMPDTNGGWTTKYFVSPDDVRHDMHVNIVSFEPGVVIPFMETHVMEHGLYVLEGKGAYKLNRDWVEVEAGDYMWLRAFCPQACYGAGDSPFRYLLYKDVNRHMPFL